MEAHDLYGSLRMATGYAFSRPTVHPRIIERIRLDLGVVEPMGRALDIGCGAGLSTAALDPLVRLAVGLEPATTMLTHRRAVAPRASFVAAVAERMPFAAGSFDIVTAAGSLNYVDMTAFLPELARVLNERGVMVIYDFSAGRRLRDDDRLDGWYAEFERRYAPRPGYEMDVRKLPYSAVGLVLKTYAPFEVAVPMTLRSYVPYVMSETGVELAVARGLDEDGIRAWCRSTLAGILDDRPRDVLFDAYVAYVARAESP